MQRPLLGRARELAELEAGLSDVFAGQGRLHLLAGEPGIGKTRLADEIAARATNSGMRVAWGRCSELGGAPPYWPWTAVLRTLLAGEAGPVSPELVQIVPELRSRVSPDAPSSLPDEHARFRLFDAVVSLLRGVGARHPALLVLDDLHAADIPSLHLLHALARELRGARLAVIGTYRDAEVSMDGERGPLLARIAREGTRHPLRRLNNEEVARFLEQVTERSADPRLVSAVCEATEGNPLCLDEVVRHLMLRGGSQDPEFARGLVTDVLREAISRNLQRLDRDARGVLEAAAVVGREFSLEVLAAALEQPASSVRDQLAPALAAELIASAKGMSGDFQFNHILIQETLYRQLGAPRRVALHGAVAAALERLHGNALDEKYAELARHHLACAPEGDLQKAVEFSERAARRAMEVLAYEEAVAHYERALRALEMRGDAGSLRNAELLAALAEAQMRLGDIRSASQSCVRVAELGRRLQNPELAAQAALTYGSQLTIGRTDPTLLDLLQEALRGLGNGGDPRIRSRLLARHAAALQPAPNPAEPLALAEEAVALARTTGDPRTLAQVIFSARAAFLPADDLRRRLALDRELVELSVALGDRVLAFHARSRLIYCLLETSDITGAEEQIIACTALARELRQPHYGWLAKMHPAMVALMQGRFAVARQFAAEARAEAERAQDPNAEATFAWYEFELRRAQHLHDEIDAHFHASVEIIARQKLKTKAQAMTEAVQFARLGRMREAKESLTVLMAPPRPLPGFAGVPSVGEVAAMVGDRAEQEWFYEALLPRAEHLDVMGMSAKCCEGAIARPLGMLAAALGRIDEARAHFERALRLNAAVGARPWVARTQYDYAQSLLRTGSAADRDLASNLLAQARATAVTLEMPGLIQQIDACAAGPVRAPSAPIAAAPPAPRDQPASWLTREGETWAVRYGETEFRLKDSRGVQLLALLLENPGREFHVLELVGGASADTDGAAADAGDAGEVFDAQAKQAYRRRAEELREELEEAQAWADSGRAARLREELEALTEELARGVGLGGRVRRAGAPAERARVNVQRRIADAIKRIGEHCPPLSRYLSKTVKTGTFCRFEPLD